MSILVVKAAGIADVRNIKKGIDDCYLADRSVTLQTKSPKNNRTIFFISNSHALPVGTN